MLHNSSQKAFPMAVGWDPIPHSGVVSAFILEMRYGTAEQIKNEQYDF